MPSEPEAGAPEGARAAVGALLTPVVGEFIARTSISMASKRIGKTPETITMGDLPALADALRPALRTILGTPAADSLVRQLRSLGAGEGGPR